MDRELEEQRHRWAVSQARIEGFVVGVVVGIPAWFVLTWFVRFYDALIDRHPGKMLIGFIGLIALPFIWMAVIARRRK
jgi:hypothetical protein